jgi:hypothetical protein
VGEIATITQQSPHLAWYFFEQKSQKHTKPNKTRFTNEEIAPLFQAACAMENVSLPNGWREINS